jgi:predicted methyltransferase
MEKIKIKEFILNELANSEKSIWELLDAAYSPLKDFMETMKNLIENGLIASNGKTLYLTEKGKQIVSASAFEFKSELCQNCQGRRITIEGKFKEILGEFKKIVKNRPKLNINFFQGYATEEDVVRRAALMHHYGDLNGREFILIGDDDLLSIALALTRLPNRIVALDIDEKLGAFIGRASREYDLDIEFRKYDVAEPLPEDLVGNFDVFSSEPLETLTGLKAFVGRGVSCLKEDGAGYFGLTILEASHKKWLAIQRTLNSMNCVITDIIRGFTAYPMNYETVDYESFVKKLKIPIEKNSGVNWYKSSLIRIEALGKPKLIIPPNKKLHIKFVDPEEDLTYPT